MSQKKKSPASKKAPAAPVPAPDKKPAKKPVPTPAPADQAPKGPLPGHETQSDEMNCPACGRFVGAVTKCPYCGAKVAKRMSLVATRWAAVLLSTVGLVLLYLMARAHEPAEIKIDDIESTMNFGNVRITGQVVANARVNRSGNGGNFRVDDGSSQKLMVFIDESMRKEMEAKHLIPLKGNEISFIAQLSSSADGTTARIRSLAPDSFSLTAGDGLDPATAPAPFGFSYPDAPADVPAATEPDFSSTADETAARAAAALDAAPADIPPPADVTPLADVTPALDGKYVTLEGDVTALTPPPADSKRPYTLTLADGAASLTLKFWQQAYDALPDKNLLVGSRVRLRAQVDTYKDKLDVKLVAPEQFQRLGPATGGSAAPDAAAPAEDDAAAPAAPARDFSRGRAAKALNIPLAEVTADKQGQTVTVRARVDSVKEPAEGTKQPYSIYLREGDASLRASCFSRAWEVIADDDKPRPNAVFELTGVVDVFQDRPQLTIKSGYKVKLVDDTPESIPPVDVSAAVPVASLPAAPDGNTIVVSGTLGAPESLKSGVKYPLTDAAGGVLSVVFWDSNLSEAVRSQLDEGVAVAVRGKLTEYEGSVQLTADRDAVAVLPAAH